MEPDPEASILFMKISGEGIRYSSLFSMKLFMNVVEKFFIVGSGINEAESDGVNTSRYPLVSKNLRILP